MNPNVQSGFWSDPVGTQFQWPLDPPGLFRTKKDCEICELGGSAPKRLQTIFSKIWVSGSDAPIGSTQDPQQMTNKPSAADNMSQTLTSGTKGLWNQSQCHRHDISGGFRNSRGKSTPWTGESSVKRQKSICTHSPPRTPKRLWVAPGIATFKAPCVDLLP